MNALLREFLLVAFILIKGIIFVDFTRTFDVLLVLLSFFLQQKGRNILFL